MRRYGLIGRRLGHSYSKRWFEDMFVREGVWDAEYDLYEFDELPEREALHHWVAEKELSGFNVTVPYKEAVVARLDELDGAAEAIGAVNCVEVRDGRLIGHNTDAPAFGETLRPLLREWHTSALVLGTGGAAKAVRYALEQRGIEAMMVSREPERHPGSVSYLEAEELVQERFVLVNATPVGMTPDEAHTPWPYNYRLGMKHLCYDLVYNPEETRFMLDAELCGAEVCNGLAMLYRQAELSWELFGSLKV